MTQEPKLPQDLLDQGFKLIIRAPDRMFAVSTNRGGTRTKRTIEEVTTEARAMASWCAWMDENWYQPIQED
jgi:hypothetical protein